MRGIVGCGGCCCCCRNMCACGLSVDVGRDLVWREFVYIVMGGELGCVGVVL
jgi:hypothetical protein